MTVNVESSKMSCYFMGKQIHFTCSKPLKNTSNFGKSVSPFEGHILNLRTHFWMKYLNFKSKIQNYGKSRHDSVQSYVWAILSENKIYNAFYDQYSPQIFSYCCCCWIFQDFDSQKASPNTSCFYCGFTMALAQCLGRRSLTFRAKIKTSPSSSKEHFQRRPILNWSIDFKVLEPKWCKANQFWN